MKLAKLIRLKGELCVVMKLTYKISEIKIGNFVMKCTNKCSKQIYHQGQVRTVNYVLYIRKCFYRVSHQYTKHGSSLMYGTKWIANFTKKVK